MKIKFNHTARAGYVIRVCIRFKLVRDTIRWCKQLDQPWGPYVNGVGKPHFPVPALRTLVYMDSEVVYILSGKHLVAFGRTYHEDTAA